MLNYFRSISTAQRSPRADIHLGMWLAFVAGAMNAGGFLALSQYTSHVTGAVSGIAGALVQGKIKVVMACVTAVVFFIIGACLTEMLACWARQKKLKSEYSLPLFIEGILLVLFTVVGRQMHRQYLWFFISATIIFLAFSMGLQNAIVTRMTRAYIRTTHMTGIATDIGIEFGRLCYHNRNLPKDHPDFVLANRSKLSVLSGLLFFFFIGGFAGAYGYYYNGYMASGVIALILFVLGTIPLIDDIRDRSKKK